MHRPSLRRTPGMALLATLAILVGEGCAPRLRPLTGELVPVALPRPTLPRGSRQLTFDWEYSDPDISSRGEGVARVTSPDSLRLDFFLAGGIPAGGAVLLADSLDTPGPEMARRLIPPPPMLWASVGRFVMPVTRDTAIRRDGEFLRADLGTPVQWRVTFRGDTLLRMEHIEGGRIVEWLERQSGNRVEYRQEVARRSLRFHIIRVEDVPAFDASIWHINH